MQSTLQLFSTVSDIETVNESFAKGVLRIAYPGVNTNGSNIKEEAFEEATQTLFNCPVVANYNVEDDTIGGHDVKVISKNGKPALINITEPVGVVPESARIFWDTVKENGTEKKYYCTEVLLWKRQPCYQKIEEDKVIQHSMEIKVNEGSVQDGVLVVDKFTFLALCLLGDDLTPCFSSSQLEAFEADAGEFKTKFEQMMVELKETYTTTPLNKEEDKMEKKLDLLLEKYSLTLEDIDFELDGMEIKEIEKKFEELQTKKFQLNTVAMLEEINRILREETEKVTDEWGYSYNRYVLMEVQDAEVIAYDYMAGYIVGIPFATAGDAIQLNPEEAKRKKVVYEDFVDGESPTAFDFIKDVQAGQSEKIKELFAAKDEEIEALKASTVELETSYSALQEKYTELNKESLENGLSQLFEKFDKILGEMEDYSALKEEYTKLIQEEKFDFDLTDVEKQCFVLIGKQEFEAKSKEDTTEPIMVAFSQRQENLEDLPYGGIHVKYGKTNRKDMEEK